jgi:hypothetical protein
MLAGWQFPYHDCRPGYVHCLAHHRTPFSISLIEISTAAFSETDLVAILIDADANTCRPVTFWINEHYVADVNRRFELDDATLHLRATTLPWLLVLFHHVDALNDDAVVPRDHTNDLATYTPVVTGN